MKHIKRFLVLCLTICLLVCFCVTGNILNVSAAEGDFNLSSAYQVAGADSNVIHYTFDKDVNQSGALGFVQIVNSDMTEVIKSPTGEELTWNAWADNIISGNTLVSYELKSNTLGISSLKDIFALVNDSASNYYGKGYKVVYTLSPHDDEPLNNGVIDKYAAADGSGFLLAPFTYNNKEAARIELLTWETVTKSITSLADKEGNFSIAAAFQTNSPDSNEIFFTFDVNVNQKGALGFVQIVNSDMTEVIKSPTGEELTWNAWADNIISGNTLVSYELKSNTLGISSLKDIFALVNDSASNYYGKGYKVVYTLSPHDDEPLYNGVIDKYMTTDESGYLLAPYMYNYKEAARIELLPWENATEAMNRSIEYFEYGTIFSIEKNENAQPETKENSVNTIVVVAVAVVLAVVLFFVISKIVKKAGKKA